jgi:hypothetical protein
MRAALVGVAVLLLGLGGLLLLMRPKAEDERAAHETAEVDADAHARTSVVIPMAGGKAPGLLDAGIRPAPVESLPRLLPVPVPEPTRAEREAFEKMHATPAEVDRYLHRRAELDAAHGPDAEVTQESLDAYSLQLDELAIEIFGLQRAEPLLSIGKFQVHVVDHDGG